MSDLKRTPLYQQHVALEAKIVPFAGYQMPVQYSGLMQEHRAVREAAGLFDVSHMGSFHLLGPDGGVFLDRVTPSRVSALPAGKAIYTALTTECGTFVDDILAYHVRDGFFLVVVNASNKAKDYAWLEQHIEGLDLTLVDASDQTALMAIQGPRARAIVDGLAEGFDGLKTKYYRVVEGRVAGKKAIASRTGYTGELGWELSVAAEDAPEVWNALLESGESKGVQPAGLGARDSLRLEAALPLYGNDIDDQTTVLEAGLEFIVDWDKTSFIGRQVLHAERAAGSTRRRVGFEVTGRGIARQGHIVWDGDRQLGAVSSGTHSPTLGKAIGMAYLPLEYSDPGQQIEIDVRGRRLTAVTTAMPFYRRPRPPKKSSQ